MPISEDARNELAAIEPRRRCDRLAELSALFHSAGSLHLKGRGEVSAHLDLSSAGVARRAFALLRSFGVASEIRTYRQQAFARPTRYQLHVEGDAHALQVLHEAGVLGTGVRPLEHPPKRIVGKACCRGAYIRGAFLGGGSLSGPRSPHLELRTATPASASFLAAVGAAEGVPLTVQERRSYSAAYAKRAETIADALALAGASDTALGFDEAAVVGEARARANRLANADHANLVRAGRAAHAQLLAVRRLEEAGRLADLPRTLREAAKLRLRHPSSSLRELAEKARPRATKAALHRRLKKLASLAER